MTTNQTQSFRELGAFLAYKTGTAQVWNARYRDGLNEYLDRYGVDVLIGSLVRSEFTNVEYAFEIWKGLDDRTEDQEWWIPAARERYHQMRKEYLQGKMDGSGVDTMAKRLNTNTTRRKKRWIPILELKKIQKRTGLPRGPDAREFARKWGLTV